MPFGLFHHPASFQALINEVPFEFLDSSFVVYFDNIMIFFPTLEALLVHIREVLKIICSNQLL